MPRPRIPTRDDLCVEKAALLDKALKARKAMLAATHRLDTAQAAYELYQAALKQVHGVMLDHRDPDLPSVRRDIFRTHYERPMVLSKDNPCVVDTFASKPVDDGSRAG